MCIIEFFHKLMQNHKKTLFSNNSNMVYYNSMDLFHGIL